MKTDYHIHSEYSYDSKIKADDLLDKAISLNYATIAITEHLDLLPQELSVFGLPSLKRYQARIRDLQSRYQGRIELVFGVEVGDYHLVRDFAQPLIERLDFGLILGSVHFLSDHTNVAVPLKQALNSEGIRDYYQHNLNLVSTCDIDVLAHLGVYKRYYQATPDESACRRLLQEIFAVVIERNIALEINFSSFRKPYGRLIPEPDQIELYRSLGGNLFTIGSDAHTLDQFDDHYSMIPHWLQAASEEFPLTRVPGI